MGKRHLIEGVGQVVRPPVGGAADWADVPPWWVVKRRTPATDDGSLRGTLGFGSGDSA